MTATTTIDHNSIGATRHPERLRPGKSKPALGDQRFVPGRSIDLAAIDAGRFAVSAVTKATITEPVNLASFTLTVFEGRRQAQLPRLRNAGTGNVIRSGAAAGITAVKHN